MLQISCFLRFYVHWFSSTHYTFEWYCLRTSEYHCAFMTAVYIRPPHYNRTNHPYPPVESQHSIRLDMCCAECSRMVFVIYTHTHIEGTWKQLIEFDEMHRTKFNWTFFTFGFYFFTSTTTTCINFSFRLSVSRIKIFPMKWRLYILNYIDTDVVVHVR